MNCDGLRRTDHARRSAMPKARSLIVKRRLTVKPRLHDYNLLSNRLSNPIDNRLYRVYKHSTTGLTTGCVVYTAGCQTGRQTGCATGLTIGCIV